MWDNRYRDNRCTVRLGFSRNSLCCGRRAVQEVTNRGYHVGYRCKLHEKPLVGENSGVIDGVDVLGLKREERKQEN